jgi:hypothetical protein
MPENDNRSAPSGATLPDPLNSNDEDASQVAAALADAAHAGGLSDPYYRKADRALRRLFARLRAAEGVHSTQRYAEPLAQVGPVQSGTLRKVALGKMWSDPDTPAPTSASLTREPCPDVARCHLDPDGPPHPDPEIERQIIRHALGYHVGEPCLFQDRGPRS